MSLRLLKIIFCAMTLGYLGAPASADARSGAARIDHEATVFADAIASASRRR